MKGAQVTSNIYWRSCPKKTKLPSPLIKENYVFVCLMTNTPSPKRIGQLSGASLLQLKGEIKEYFRWKTCRYSSQRLSRDVCRCHNSALDELTYNNCGSVFSYKFFWSICIMEILERSFYCAKIISSKKPFFFIVSVFFTFRTYAYLFIDTKQSHRRKHIHIGSSSFPRAWPHGNSTHKLLLSLDLLLQQL